MGNDLTEFIDGIEKELRGEAPESTEQRYWFFMGASGALVKSARYLSKDDAKCHDTLALAAAADRVLAIAKSEPGPDVIYATPPENRRESSPLRN